MYGLVNRAIEQLVVSLKGEAGWQRVCARAGSDGEGFIAMQAYDDGVTYALVGAVCEETGLSPEQVLEAFGEYWILYTAEEGYGDLLDSAGTTLRQFLGSLNDMHGRVEAIFPHMRLPVFRVEDQPDGSYHLIYHSEREGLAPMVVGLVKGLAKRLQQPVSVLPMPCPAGATAVFHVIHQPA